MIIQPHSSCCWPTAVSPNSGWGKSGRGKKNTNPKPDRQGLSLIPTTADWIELSVYDLLRECLGNWKREYRKRGEKRRKQERKRKVCRRRREDREWENERKANDARSQWKVRKREEKETWEEETRKEYEERRGGGGGEEVGEEAKTREETSEERRGN